MPASPDPDGVGIVAPTPLIRAPWLLAILLVEAAGVATDKERDDDRQ